MYHEHDVGVVVPAYNEGRFIGTVLETVPSFVDTVYVVDDHSTDDTWREIERHADDTEADAPDATAADGGGSTGTGTAPTVVPIRHAENRGRGAAVKTGYRTALSDGMDVVAVMDGDGQMDPAILEEIIEPVVRDEADYVVGDRLNGPTSAAEMPPFRRFGNHLLTVLTRVASGYWSLSDPQNGYTAISRDALATVDVDALYDDYGFLNDLLTHLNVHGFEVTNVPMRARYGDEESGIRYSSFVPKLSLLLCRLFLWRLRVTKVGGRGSGSRAETASEVTETGAETGTSATIDPASGRLNVRVRIGEEESEVSTGSESP